jgi:hypothetical protein
MTTLYLDGAKNTDRFKDGSVDVLPHFGCLELPQISSQVIQVWRIAAWKCNRHFMYWHFDERLVPHLPRDRGRSIGGDLDIGEEGSKRTIVTLQLLHHGSIGCHTHRHKLALPRRLSSCRCNREHNQEQGRMQLNCRWVYNSWIWGFPNRRAANSS